MINLTEQEIFKLLVAMLVGGLIGLEREMHAKAAGLRTITLITIGSTLFTMLSVQLGSGDPGRIAANIVTGVGFLGAGSILFSEGRVKGLTTASSIWVAAALGMAIGLGYYGLAGAATFLVLLVLWLFARFDRLIDILGREVRTYEISYPPDAGKFRRIETLIEESGLKSLQRRRSKVSETLWQGQWELRGPLKLHSKFVDHLLSDDDIVELRY